MDEQNTNSKIDAVVGDIHKDFVVVGKHRVHSWYAWAIVGIVFGMALGIVYVANRSGEFVDSQAAKIQTNLTVVGGIDAFIPVIARAGDQNAWLSNAPITYNPDIPYVIQDKRPLYTAPGTQIGQIIKGDNSKLGVIGIKGSKLYYGVQTPTGFTIDTQNQSATADLNKEVSYVIKGIYVRDYDDPKKQPTRSDVPVSATLYCGSNLTSGTKCTDYGRSFNVSGASNSFKMHEGVPVYLNYFTITLPNGKTPTIARNILFPAGGGTFTIVVRNNLETGNLYVVRVVAKAGETGPEVPIDSPEDST